MKGLKDRIGFYRTESVFSGQKISNLTFLNHHLGCENNKGNLPFKIDNLF